MFRIEKRTWEAFDRAVIEGFERRMVTHLRKFYPGECAALGGDQVGLLIRHGVL